VATPGCQSAKGTSVVAVCGTALAAVHRSSSHSYHSSWASPGLAILEARQVPVRLDGFRPKSDALGRPPARSTSQAAIDYKKYMEMSKILYKLDKAMCT